MKTLIVYYSLSGNVKEKAEELAEKLSADLLRIEPVKEIPTDSRNKMIMTGGMYATFGILPKLKPLGVDLEPYDSIILGTPVWAGKPAVAASAFVKTCGCPEKIYGVFTCSGSGNNDKCLDYLEKRLDNLKYAASFADNYNEELAKYNDEVMADFLGNMQ